MASPASFTAPEARSTDAGPAGRRVRHARIRLPRGSAGLSAPAGAHRAAPAWWGAAHWCEVVVPHALDVGLRSMHHPVSRDTALMIARAFARFADRRTGRNCRPTNETIAALTHVCVRTVQRVRRLLEDLGVMVELVRGRSILTREERLTAWRHHSSVRQIASEVALVVPAVYARTVHRLGPRAVGGVIPPGHSVGERVSHLGVGVLRKPKDRRMSPAPPGTYPRARAAPASPVWARHSRLVAGLQQHVPWLRGVSPRRLTSLHRFARERWTPRDVQRALEDVLRARSWTLPAEVENPPAYLARLLREVDEADRPGAVDEAIEAQLAARRRWERLTVFGPECAHGQPAGDVPHPVDGHLACPFCRHTRRSTT